MSIQDLMNSSHGLGQKRNWGGGGSDHAFPLLHPHLGGDGIDVPG